MRKLDRVFIKNLRIQGILGVYDQERHQPRQILVNLTLHTNTRRAARTDLIRDCVDYDQIAQEIRALVEGAMRFTVEALAEDIARLCLGKPGVRKVSVRVEKPGAVAVADSVGVEIIRRNYLNLKR
jgi:FolB domain-containing protein